MALIMYFVIIGLMGLIVLITLVGVGYARIREEEARADVVQEWVGPLSPTKTPVRNYQIEASILKTREQQRKPIPRTKLRNNVKNYVRRYCK
jgi:hypothetical protein